ncbi:putative serine/threonine-protein kinase isoform X2 [Jatropha curcas]|uniref:putative serine/threonine-protein kinase isoform X2 n=1 Tax=Jatropha curcas TaxID=180498 RepID=UPI0009D72635|nr:putative serine/threonine-protein kinase isoform X2 [Jatropha curcas]
MSKPYAAIVGGAAGVALVAIFIILWFCKSHCKNFSNKNSETGSSDPYAVVEWNRGGQCSSAPGRPLFGSQGARAFTMDELEQATKQFSESNLIGYGSFGSVYKGLLQDTTVAIKRRPSAPREDFVAEVFYLSEIRHRNLVSLLGYCQERDSQMLVFEYVPNDSIGNHLYGLTSSTKLEFKQRLSIALGAAKGLCHLHGLNPPLVHKNFKTTNVLVDENFLVKVADAGISKLLEKIEEAGPSYTSGVNVFWDPETGVSGTFTEMSDVYSFGVFLLELITGQEAIHLGFLGYDEGLIQWVASRLNSNNFVDRRLLGSFTEDGIRDLIRLTLQCMSFPRIGRPKMEMIVVELERIHEKEMALTTVTGDGTATFIKGSELFTSK